MSGAYSGSAAKLFAFVVCVALIPTTALAQKLATGIAKAADFTPSKTAYVVTSDVPLYKSPALDMSQPPSATLMRGEHPEVLGEAGGGTWLLIGKADVGIGYTQRALLCPVTVCKDVKDEARAFTVYFPSQQSKLTADAQKVLEQAVLYSGGGSTGPEASEVTVVDYADPSGSGKSNLVALSERRTKEVIDALLAMGIPADHLAVQQGKGDTDLAVPTAKSNRVTIKIEF